MTSTSLIASPFAPCAVPRAISALLLSLIVPNRRLTVSEICVSILPPFLSVLQFESNLKATWAWVYRKPYVLFAAPSDAQWSMLLDFVEDDREMKTGQFVDGPNG